jgi:peptidoglycan hydrolase CwlO-like protein
MPQMTTPLTRFPTPSRVIVAVLCLMVLVLVPGGSGSAVTKQDVSNANARVERILGKIKSARAQLTVLQQQVAAATDRMVAAQDRLDQTTAQLLDTRDKLDAAKQLHDETIQQLDERAVQAFIGGAGQNLEFLVGSSSLSELSDRLEYMNVIAQSDADLAQTVQNTQNELDYRASKLADLQAQQQAAAQQARQEEAAVTKNFEAQQSAVTWIGKLLDQAERYKKKVSKQYQDQLRAASQGSYGGGHSPVAVPSSFSGVLQVCPVDGPRSFGDGFGAPRYFGGYHLHKGVDILAPFGTPIVAPFDGYASTGYNAAGGNTVSVQGAIGKVYNAHLSSFSSNSNGPVHTGDVIGYVGDTGDAHPIMHDHFEFHPNVMPSSWPVSAYGYSIIEDAVNPYPLLVQACG